MVNALRIHVLMSCLVLAPLFSGGARAPAADDPPFGQTRDPEATPATPEPVVLATDPLVRRKIEAVQDYIKVRSWAEAVRVLQGLLDARTDAFLAPRSGEARAQPGARWQSAHAEAERLLGTMPPEGKEFYRLSFDGTAARLLAEARSRGDRAALHAVARRFRYTHAGAEALGLLGNYYLDRGQPALAAACFRRLFDTSATERFSPRTLHLAALAFRATGEIDREAAAWKELTNRQDGAPLRIGTRSFTVEALRRQAARLWPGSPAEGMLAEDWPLYRGNTQRSVSVAGGSVLLQATWRLPLASGETADWLRRAQSKSPQSVLTGAVPLAVGGRIILRSPSGVQSFDAETGRLLWQARSPLSLEALLANPGAKVQLRYWFDQYGPLRSLLLTNSTVGTLSSDGQRIYAVEDLPLPPFPGLVQPDQPDEVRSLGPLRHVARHNRLKALDLASGAVVWEIGGQSPKAAALRLPPSKGPASPAPARATRPPARMARDALLEDAFFRGPPLPLGDELLVLVEKQEDVQLVCLGAARGEVRWTQDLAAAGEKMLLDVARHTHAAHLAFGEGILVCPTHCGAVIAVDPLARRLLWAHVYREPPPPTNTEEETPAVSRPHETWTACAPLIQAGRVVNTAPDAESVFCLDLHDGRLVWKAARMDDDLYIGGVFAGQVLVIGRTACRSLSLSTGEVLWRRTTGPPAGQGAAAGLVYYLPLADGGAFALDLAHPAASCRLEPRGSVERLGNLMFYRGTLWSQTAGGLTSFTPLQNRFDAIEARLARAPHDGEALAERGRLRLEKGDLTGGIADLREALRQPLRPRDQTEVRRRLLGSMAELLRLDFPAGEKYLDECQALYNQVPGKNGAAPTAEEMHERRQQLTILLARGREKQGRVVEAVAAWHRLLAQAHPGELLALPEDANLHVRPDVLVRQRIAMLASGADSAHRSLLAAEIDRQWQTILRDSDRIAGLGHYLELFGSLPPLAGVQASGTEVQLRLASLLAESADPRRALDADPMLSALAESSGRVERGSAAQALALQGRLRLRLGRPAEAAECFRRLGHDFGDVAVEGRTGAALLAEARLDKRLLYCIDGLSPQEPPAWQGARLQAVERPAGPPSDAQLLPCVPRQSVLPFGPGGEDPWPRSNSLRFFVDTRSGRLQAMHRDTGTTEWTLSLPVPALPRSLVNGEIPCQVLNHLLLLPLGNKLLGIDLLGRRVRWMRDGFEGLTPTPSVAATIPDGGFNVVNPDGQSLRRFGWVGPATRDGLFFLTAAGLHCLDPATGETRWVRSDVPPTPVVFTDSEMVFVGEHTPNGSPRTLRAVHRADGTIVSIPDASAVYGRRLRVLGRRLLLSEEGLGGAAVLRLYDALTGKDVWTATYPAGSLILSRAGADILGVALPDGTVAVIDLVAARQVIRLKIDPRHRAKTTAGFLLADARQFYVGLAGPAEETLSVQDGPNPFFRAGLTGIPINGLLYAFDRNSGELRWYAQAPAQALLLERFEELPILICAAQTTRATAVPGAAENVIAVRTIDKQTGKLLFNREYRAGGEPFHALRLDPHAGTVDLASGTMLLRHQPIRK
jgi:outer membrane protein assembly factor BamB/tetratricopeptide (TPR) repeat protein